MNKLTILGMLGLLFCMMGVGCVAPGGAATTPAGEGIATPTSGGVDLQVLAADAQDLAQGVAALELANQKTPPERERKRQRIEVLVREMEKLAMADNADASQVARLIRGAIGNLESPDAALKVAAGQILLRHAGLNLDVPVESPEQVRTVADGVAKGLRAALAGQ